MKIMYRVSQNDVNALMRVSRIFKIAKNDESLGEKCKRTSCSPIPYLQNTENRMLIGSLEQK